MPEKQVLTSLTGAVAPLLTGDTKNPSELMFISPFLPRGWKKSVPYVTDYMRVDTLSNPRMNGENVFEITKFAHGITDFVIRTVFPPGSVTGNANPVQANYTDFTGWSYWHHFKIKYLANEVFDVFPYDLYFEHRMNNEIEKRDAINELILGDTSTAIRTAAFANGTELYTDFFLPFQKARQKMLPIVALAQKIRFVLTTKSLQEFTRIQVPTITNESVTFNDVDPSFQALIEVVHITANESGLLLAMSQNESGLNYLIHQHVRQETESIGTLQSNVEVPVKLNGITKPIRILNFALIPETMTNNTNRNDQFFFKPNPPLPIPFGLNPYNPINQWRIEANGQIVQRSLYRNQNRVHMHHRYSCAPHGDEFFTQYYGSKPNSVDIADGYLDFTNLNNPLIFISLGVGGTGQSLTNPNIPQQLRVIVNCEDYNFWYMKKGNWSRSFN